MKILVISKCPTHPTTAGNRWAVLAQANILASLGCEIYFLFIDERPFRKDATLYEEDFQKTKAYWGNRFFHLRISKAEKFRFNAMKVFNTKFRNGYQSCDVNYPHALTAMVNRIDEQYHFDACIVNYYYLTKLFEHVRIPKKALHTHDCIAYKDLKIGEKTMCIDANTEAKAMQRSPYIFALQDEEAAYFQLLSPRSKVYNIYSKYEYQSQPTTNNHNILFLSGNNGFNQNGIRWFVDDVFPFIREKFEDTRLLIGGAICNTMKDLKDVAGVKLLGFVDKLSDFYRLGDVAINPVFQGTGLKIKTFEAISYDKVTLVHPHSMAGIFHKDRAPLFASDKPEEWVGFLKQVWEKPGFIPAWKERNKAYMERLDSYVISEYKRFIKE